MKFTSLFTMGCSVLTLATVSATEPLYLDQPGQFNQSSSAPVMYYSDIQLPAPVSDPVSAPAPIINQPIVTGDIYYAPVMPISVQCVPTKVRGERNIASNAVPVIVSVPNPCYDKCDPASGPCVNVEICIPPCKTASVKFRRQGDKMIYDYGREEVSITTRRNDILVAYN